MWRVPSERLLGKCRVEGCDGQLHADVHQRRGEEGLDGALGDKNSEGVKGEKREKTDLPASQASTSRKRVVR